MPVLAALLRNWRGSCQSNEVLVLPEQVLVRLLQGQRNSGRQLLKGLLELVSKRVLPASDYL